MPMIRTAAGLLALLLAIGTSAQTAVDTRVLKGGDVNEAELLSALTPPEKGIQTRGFAPSADKHAPMKAAQRRPSASLLITFETNSFELSADAREQLDVVAGALKNDKLARYSFLVEGHADPRGVSEANMLLSQRRAESVRRYLVDQHGIDGFRLSAIGKGDLEPLIRSVPAAPENRRVTLVTQMKSE